MSYTPNIPQATDDPSESQPLILANFQQLNTQYGTAGDHVEWTASSNNGKHKKVTWIDQSASPPSAGLNEMVAYAITQSGITMPYYKRDNVATVFPLAPIKAYASFTSITGGGTQNITPDDFFNITSPIVQTGGGLDFAITLTQACRTSNYGVLFFSNSPTNVGLGFGYTISTSSLFHITSPYNALTARRMTVIVLET
jgi:hypothetical protein